MEFKYNITLSFAGEDREYVDQVAEILKQEGVKVFYDKFEEADLWGKDLGIILILFIGKVLYFAFRLIQNTIKERYGQTMN